MDERKPFEFQRHPATPKKIADINGNDVRVRISGTVLDFTNSIIVLDDGTGRAEIVSEIPAKEGSFVRVFARVLALEDRYELRAELIQDLSGTDKNLYKKVYG